MTNHIEADKLKPVDVYSQNNATAAIAICKVGDRFSLVIGHWVLGMGNWLSQNKPLIPVILPCNTAIEEL